MVVDKSKYHLHIRFSVCLQIMLPLSGDVLFLNIKIILKNNFKKLLKFFEIFFVQCQGYENYSKVVKGVQKLLDKF